MGGRWGGDGGAMGGRWGGDGVVVLGGVCESGSVNIVSA